MKTKFKTLLLAMLIGVVGAQQANAADSDKVYVISPGGEVTYQLNQMPHINYTTEGDVKYAQLLLGDSKEPVAKVEMKDGKTLSVFFGTYNPTGINGVISDKVTTYTKDGRKYITGGKLIIIGNDGKKYNANGIEIKNQ